MSESKYDIGSILTAKEEASKDLFELLIVRQKTLLESILLRC